MRNVAFLALAGLVWGAVAEAQSNSPGLSLESVTNAAPGVTAIAMAPGESDLYIAHQDGRIFIKNATGLVAQPFLDLRGQVATGLEEGLLGLAFHPGYASNGYVYVHYVNVAGSVVVARYVRNPITKVADPSSALVLLTIPHTQPRHHGGQLAFGPDGFLYIASGDGGEFWDPSNKAQSLNTLLGKLLRIDVNGTQPYSVPPTNPFVSTSGAAGEIWAYGLRNPWRFSFDRLTGDLFLGDVGQDFLEEIDFEHAGSPGGLNYGWRRKEGTRCTDPANPFREPPPACSDAGLTAPIMEYGRFDGCSVTGGYRYRGTTIPGLNGFYLFGDYCRSTVWASRPDATGAWVFAPILQAPGSGLRTFGQDNSGELYVGVEGGSVSRIVGGTPGVSVSHAAPIAEGDAGTRDAVFTVFLLPSTSDTVTVNYSASSSTAQAGTDFTPTAGTLTFPPHATSATISVPVLGDQQYENDETFFLFLTSAVNAAVTSVGRAGRAVIVNDDSSLSIADVSRNEGDAGTTDAVLTVTLTRAAGATNTVTVDYATADGSAAAGSDYVTTTGTLVFLPGVQTATIRVPVVGDILVEPADTFTLTLSNPAGASIARAVATVTIINDDTGPRISADNVTVAEGNTGSVEAVFTVSLERASEQTVTVNYRTFGLDAFPLGAYPDFVDTGGTLTFLPGITSLTVSVTVLADLLDEVDEAFSLSLDAPVNGRLGASGRGTILDDDAPPVASLSGAPVVIEGDSGRKAAAFRLDLSAPSGRTVQVPFRTIPVTATEGVEVFPVGSELVVAWNGQASNPYPAVATVPAFTGAVRRVHVTVNLQRTTESAFSPSLLANYDILLVGPLGQKVMLMSDVAADFGTATSVSLEFDDLAPALGSGLQGSGRYRPTNVNAEGDSDAMPSPAPAGPYGSSMSVFDGVNPIGQWKLFVSGDLPATTRALRASLTIAVETDADYLKTTGSVGLVQGVTAATIFVQVLGDRADEEDETFDLEIYGPVNATLGASRATATIADDDEPPVAFFARDVTVDLASTDTEARFIVALDQPSSRVTSVSYATGDGTAVAGSDYVARSGRLEFEPGTTSKAVDVTVTADGAPGPTKAFRLLLTDPVGATIADGEAIAALVPPLPLLTIGDAAIAEGNFASRTIDFPVTLSAPPYLPVSVAYSTADGSATGAGQDYVPVTGILNFAPGTTTGVVSVTIPADGVVEPDETFVLNLSSPVNARFGDDQATATLRNDDAAQQFQFSRAAYSAIEGRLATVVVRRTGDLQGAASVGYESADGSASGGGPSPDYVPTAGILNFASGQELNSFAVQLIAAATYEPDETILLRLRSPEPDDGAALGHPANAVLTVRDENTGGVVQFGASAVSVGESAGVVRLVVRRTGGTAAGSTVRFATSRQTASGSGEDYGDAAGVIVFGATGPTSATRAIEIPIIADSLSEGAETFTVTLEDAGPGVTLGTPSIVMVTIEDDEATLEFAAPSYEVDEGRPSVLLTVKRTGALSGTASVGFTSGAMGDTATPGEDYRPIAGTIFFPRNFASKAILLPILPDRLLEGTETLGVTLAGVSGASLGARSLARVAILDNDVAPSVAFAKPSFDVGEGGRLARLILHRTGPTDRVLMVDVHDRPELGTAGPMDYGLSTSNPLTFGVGQQSATVSVEIRQDVVAEGAEIVSFEVSNPRGEGGATVVGAQSTAILRISDDERPLSSPTIQFEAGQYSGVEGQSTFVTLTRTGDLATASSVQYFAEGGTAASSPGTAADYALPPMTLIFAPGESTRMLSVTPLSDTTVERDETFRLKLQYVGGATYGSPREAVFTIRDGAPGQAQFTAAGYAVQESAGGATVTVERIGGAEGPVTVHHRVGVGTEGVPAGPADFDPISGVLSFASGETEKTFWVPVHANALADTGAVSVRLSLESPTGGLALGARGEATLWIIRE